MGQFLRLVAKAIILVAVVTPTVAQASDNPLPDRKATITIKGLDTNNLNGRHWYLYLDDKSGNSSTIITPGILTPITPTESEFTFDVTAATSCDVTGVLYIGFGKPPTGSCCVDGVNHSNMTQHECAEQLNTCSNPPSQPTQRVWTVSEPPACVGSTSGDCHCSTTGTCCIEIEGVVTCHPHYTQQDCVSHPGVWYANTDCNEGQCAAPGNCDPGASGGDSIPTAPFSPTHKSHHMWWIKTEFAFCDPGGSESDGMIDISYVQEFSHPLSVKVYGSNTEGDFTTTTLRGTLSPTCMIKQTIINNLWKSPGFQTPDGKHSGGNAPSLPPDCTIAPVWVCSKSNCEQGTTLWQNPAPGQPWDAIDESGFIRVNQPGYLHALYTEQACFSPSGSPYQTNPVLPGYGDAMKHLYSKYPVGIGKPAILISGSFAASCNARNLYDTAPAHGDPGYELCINPDPDCQVHPPFPNPTTDKYRVWAQVGRTSSGPPYAYWFELHQVNPKDTSQPSFLLADVGGGYWYPNETLKIPSNGSSGGSVGEINSLFYARISMADITSSGSTTPGSLPAMSWSGTIGENGPSGNASAVAYTYLRAVVRDIAATLGQGQLGAKARIGYAFEVEHPKCGHDSLASQGFKGFFWLAGNQMVSDGQPGHTIYGVPNLGGKMLSNWDAAISWNYCGQSCCCAPLSEPSGHTDVYPAFSGLPTDLATGQLVYLNNWFSDIALGACCIDSACSQITEARCKERNGTFYGYNTTCPETDCPTTHDPTRPWSQTYEAMYSELGSEVYTSSFSDFWQRPDWHSSRKGPQLPSNHYKYMKYEFELGTMTLGDITDHSGLGTHGDRKVDVADLLHMLAAWGPEGITDLNGDHIVNRDDLIVLLNNWAP